MKFLIIFSIFIHLTLSFSVKVYKFECDASENVTHIEACVVKDQKLSFVLNVVKPCSALNVETELKVAVKTRMRPFFKTSYNWCEVVKGGLKTNFLCKISSAIMQGRGDDFLRSCPWIGHFAVRNLTLPQKALGMLPPGRYKYYYKSLNHEDELVVSIFADFHVEK